MKAFADLADLPEDARIEIIGKAASDGAVVGFVVDDDNKADRYIRKLSEQFHVRVIDRSEGPVKHTVLVRIGPIAH